MRPAQCAAKRKPPRSTKRTTSGITAKIELSPSDPPTGSYTWWYICTPPPAPVVPEAGWLQTQLPEYAGVSERIAAGLREDAEAMRPGADPDALDQPAAAGRDRIDDAVVAAAQPQDLAVGRDAAHVRRAATADAPFADGVARLEGDQRDRALAAV